MGESSSSLETFNFRKVVKDLTSGKRNKQRQPAQQSDQTLNYFNKKKFTAARTLAKKLPICTKASLETITARECVEELVDLLQQQAVRNDIKYRIYASRALILLCHSFPSATDAVVDFNGVNAFVKILTEIHDLGLNIEKKENESQKCPTVILEDLSLEDLSVEDQEAVAQAAADQAAADQAAAEELLSTYFKQRHMKALKTISEKSPTLCWKAGALEAVLPFFKSSIDFKVASSIAMNTCEGVMADDAIYVCLPLLSEHLKDGDAEVVNVSLICLAEIVKPFESSSHILDEILCDELIEQVATVTSSHNSGGGQASLTTSARMASVLLLTICAKRSDLGSKIFTNIIISVKDLFTGSGGILTATSGTEEQIFKIVNLANELLPPLPEDQDDPSRSEISSREELLINQPMLLQNFGLILPSLIQICEGSVGALIPHTCLLVIAKFMYFSSSDVIDSLAIGQRISSFLSGVLARKDPIVLYYALRIAKILMEKMPQIFPKIFVREGFMMAVSALTVPGCTAFPKRSSCEEGSKHSGLAVGSPPNPKEVLTSINHISQAIYNSYGLELVDGWSMTVLHLKDLCSKLIGFCNQRSESEGPHDNEDSLIFEILKYLSEGDGVSTVEFIGSGVVDAFLNYLLCGVASKENISESNISIYRKEAMRRCHFFITMTLSSGHHDMKGPPMSKLVKKLQEALSFLEHFPLVLAADGLCSLDMTWNVRLCKAKGEESLTDYSSNIVQFHPLQTLSDVEEFLWRRVQLNKSGEWLERPPTSPKLIFFAGEKKLNSNMSVYEAIQGFIINEMEAYKNSGESRLGGNIYTITYQSANHPTEVVSVERLGSTSLSKSKEYVSLVDPSKQRVSLMDSILSGELQCDLEKSNPCYNILALLRVLVGLNDQALRKLAMAESSYKGSISSGDIWESDASISVKKFINKTLTLKLKSQIEDALSLASEILPSWCYQLTKACPFLFPFETRRQFFYSTAFGNARALHNLQQKQGVPDIYDKRFGRFEVSICRVSRDCILDSAKELMKLNSNLKAVLEIHFYDRVDFGLKSTVEFYKLLSDDLRKVGLGMWRFNSASKSPVFDDLIQAPLGLFPRQLTDGEEGVAFQKVLDNFELLGRVVAKALYDKRHLDLPLSSAFYKLLLGQKLKIHDIKSFDAELGEKLLKLQGVVKGSCESENSSHGYMLPDYPYKDKVDINNLEVYVNHVVNATIGEGISRQLKALRDGFSQVFDISSLQIFSPRELEYMLCGRNLLEMDAVGDLCSDGD